MDVTVTQDQQDRYIVACPSTEWQTRVDLVSALKQVTQGKSFTGLIVDLHGVAYINSAGLGAIFALRKYAKENGAQIVVSRPTISVNRLLQTVNLGQLMPVVDTLEAAREKLA